MCDIVGTTPTLAIEGGDTLRVSEDDDDSCVVGYYTRDDDKKPHYHYATVF
jgi:hypothetical protein